MTTAARTGVGALRAWLWALVVTAALATGALSWLLIHLTGRPGPGPAGDVVLAPPARLGLEELTSRLGALGVVEHPFALLALLRLLDAGPALRGTHTLVSADRSISDLLPRLLNDRGRAVLRLTFPEGFDRFDTADKLARFGIVDRATFLRLTADAGFLGDHGIAADTAEGYLFPDTYDLRVEGKPAAAPHTSIRVFRKRTDPLFAQEETALARLREELGFDTHAVVTLASVVEKEARRPSERATIAGVFLNRLRDPAFRPHRLQADPTVAYGCKVAPEAAPSCADFDGRRVTPAMVRDPGNPYNTYRHDGLPPGPICNPGLESIRAVLHAEQHRYYYFVANGDGSHTFSETLDDHNRAIARGRDGG